MTTVETVVVEKFESYEAESGGGINFTDISITVRIPDAWGGQRLTFGSFKKSKKEKVQPLTGFYWDRGFYFNEASRLHILEMLKSHRLFCPERIFVQITDALTTRFRERRRELILS